MNDVREGFHNRDFIILFYSLKNINYDLRRGLNEGNIL
jgi:hypothetical protein